jgi:hypothetical protein
MSTYTSETRVLVHPFTRQRDAEETVIGRPETAVFLVLPNDAVEILDDLANGKTVAQAQADYREKYGEIPDMEDLLVYLESKGFLEPQPEETEAGSSPVAPRIQAPPQSSQPQARYHFTSIPQSLARRIFNLYTVAAGCALIALAVAALVAEPSLLPSWRDLFFHQNMSVLILTVIALYYSSIFVHEMSHLVAARAAGVYSRMGISHRLWMLVAETDISGLWGVPKNQRYLPLLAGPLVDATSASVLILLLYASSHHLLSLAAPVVTLCRAMVLVYFLALSWQCFFFVRTDFYYVIANFFGCKSLLKDTEGFLRNQAARLLPSVRTVDQSRIPAQEMRVVRGYAIVWLLGRIAALWVLFFIHIPLMVHYLRLIASTLAAGDRGNFDTYLATLIMASFVVIPLAAGFLLWVRSMMKPARSA